MNSSSERLLLYLISMDLFCFDLTAKQRQHSFCTAESDLTTMKLEYKIARARKGRGVCTGPLGR